MRARYRTTLLVSVAMPTLLLAPLRALAQRTADLQAPGSIWAVARTEPAATTKISLMPPPSTFIDGFRSPFSALPTNRSEGKSPQSLTPEQAADEADRLEDLKMFTESIPYYNWAIKTAPTALRYCNRGIAYYELGDMKNALRDFQSAVKLDPKDPVSWTNLANSLDSFDRYSEALDACNKALLADPNHEKALIERAYIYRMTKKYDKSLGDLQTALRLVPKDPWVFSGLGNTYLATKAYQKAVDNFTHSIELQPTEGAYDGRVQAYIELNRTDQAEADARAILKINPKYELAYFRLGLIYSQRKMHQQAESNYLKCLELNPQEYNADFNLANQYWFLGEYDQAINFYSKYLAAYPGDAETLYDLGRCYAANNQFEKAIANFNQVLAKQPQDAATIWERGKAYEAIGQEKQAVEAYTSLLSMRPPVDNYLDVLFRRASAYNELAQNEDALKDYNELIAKAKSPDQEFYCGKSHSLAMLGRFTEALAAAQKAFELNRGSAQAYASRSICYRLMGRDEDCLKDAEAALKIDPKNLDALQSRACILIDRDQLDAAEKDISLATAEAPTISFNYCIKAEIDLEKGDLAGAKIDIDNAAKYDDCSYMSYLVRWQYAVNRLDYKNAVEICTEGMKRLPNTAKLYTLRGEAYEYLQDYTNALADATQAIQMQPNNPKFFAFRSAVYRRTKQLDKALEDIDKAIALTPDNPGWLAQKATIEGLQKHYDQAIADYNKAEALEPANCEYAIDRGYIYEAEKKDDLAMAEFEKAIKISPSKGDGYNSLARSYFTSKNYDAVIREATRGIAAVPKDSSLYDTRGDGYSHKEDEQHAYNDYATALGMSPYSPTYLYDCQRTGLKLGKYDEALKDATLEAKLAPYPRNLYDKALVEFCVGQYQNAADDFTAAIAPKDWGEDDPHPTYAAIFAAICFKQLGQQDKASQVLSRSELEQTKWPHPAVQFLQGKLTADELIARTTAEGKTDNDQMTEAKTYTALIALQQGNQSLADENFRWVVQNADKGFDEYIISIARLNHAETKVAEIQPAHSATTGSDASASAPASAPAPAVPSSNESHNFDDTSNQNEKHNQQ
jgi:tetratricopeptide (TPR) repeat protein